MLDVHAYTLNNRNDPIPLFHSLAQMGKGAAEKKKGGVSLTLLYNSICPSARLPSISFISASFAYWKVVCSRRVSLLKVSEVSWAVVTASVSCSSCQHGAVTSRTTPTSFIFASIFFIFSTLLLSSSAPLIASILSLRYALSPKPELPACPLIIADSLSLSAVTPDRYSVSSSRSSCFWSLNLSTARCA